MVSPWLERTELLIGEADLKKLENSKVLLIGLGGVGSYAGEFLCRAGIGSLTIVDGDVVDITNTNRQLPALHSTVGQSKAVLMGERMKAINPNVNLTVIQEFLLPERMQVLVGEGFDFALDCIDSLQPKIDLIKSCVESKTPIISSMGAGGKIDTSKVKLSDLSKTYNCPFALMVRKRLRQQGVKPEGIMSVFSDEPVIKESLKLTDGSNYKRSFFGTISYIPALFGLHMAGYVIRKLCDRI
ncbi:MAG: tRNA threonylcarbamoyladenosine dehydratase [Saprospiraceae bacterium]|nr:tRNA threonylcarbamoyladenosine dehydratase [Saprospiraceae bacterium]